MYRHLLGMRVVFFLSLAVLFSAPLALAQPSLRPSVGLANPPQPADQICPIVPFATNNFDNVGISLGSKVNDFTLYDREGNPLTLSKELAKGNPVLLLSGSYTCTYFRSKIPFINSLYQRYADRLKIFIIYCIEAHPIIDDPPYLDEPLADQENLDQGIQYRQPTTYGDRRAIAADMIKSQIIEPPILFDGPCNEWNSNFGPAPNIAYLIDTAGVVRARQGWFDLGGDITVDIDNLLSGSAPSLASDTGIFSVRFPGNDTVRGLPGSTMAVSAEIVNESNADAIVNINRVKTDIPTNWSTSLCADVCFISSVDSTSVRVLAHSTQEVKVYFYAGRNLGEGNVRLTFSNKNVSGNSTTKDFHAIATTNLSVAPSGDQGATTVNIFPSPATNEITIRTPVSYEHLRILDCSGRLLREFGPQTTLDISNLSSGTYLIQLFTATDHMIGTARFIKD